MSSPGPVNQARSTRPDEIAEELAIKFVEVATAVLEGLAAFPMPGRGVLPAFPQAPESTGGPGAYDLEAARSFADDDWRAQHSSPWLRRLLPETPPSPEEPPPQLDDPRWARVLSRALAEARMGPLPRPLLDALQTLYVQRQLHVLPRYRTQTPREVDVAVHELANRIHQVGRP